MDLGSVTASFCSLAFLPKASALPEDPVPSSAVNFVNGSDEVDVSFKICSRAANVHDRTMLSIKRSEKTVS